MFTMIKEAHNIVSTFTEYQYRYIKLHIHIFHYDLKPSVINKTRFPYVQITIMYAKSKGWGKKIICSIFLIPLTTWFFSSNYLM